MKLSVSLSWRDEMNFYRARSMLLDNSLGCFVSLYFYSEKFDIAFDKIEFLSL